MKEHKNLYHQLVSKVTLHFVWGHLSRKQQCNGKSCNDSIFLTETLFLPLQAEANQRKQALDAIGKRFNQTNEEKRGLENDYRGLLERENVLKSALKTAEERCVYVDRFQELLSRYTLILINKGQQL